MVKGGSKEILYMRWSYKLMERMIVKIIFGLLIIVIGQD